MQSLFNWYTNIIGRIFRVRFRPRVIQLPITGKCNSRCTTCNVWKISENVDIDANKLKNAFRSQVFSKVVSVGINGGEPSLHKDFISVVNAVCMLPSLKSIYLISNGIATDLILSQLKSIKSICTKHGVALHLTLSIDGTADTHDKTRGIPKSFDRVFTTLKRVCDEKALCCDTFNVRYTISKNNCYDMIALQEQLRPMDVHIDYHLAVPNKRLHTFDCDNYSVFDDQDASFSAREFFYSEFVSAKDFKKLSKSFLSFKYLTNNGKRRLAICNYLRRDITIDEKLNVYLCATASNCVGSLLDSTPEMLFSSKNLDNESLLIESNCSTCIHYATVPTLRSVILIIAELTAKINLIIELIFCRIQFLRKGK